MGECMEKLVFLTKDDEEIKIKLGFDDVAIAYSFILSSLDAWAIGDKC